MKDKDISQILKADIKIEDGIFCCMNDHFVSGDNQKCMIGCLSFMILEKNG